MLWLQKHQPLQKHIKIAILNRLPAANQGTPIFIALRKMKNCIVHTISFTRNVNTKNTNPTL